MSAVFVESFSQIQNGSNVLEILLLFYVVIIITAFEMRGRE